MYVLMRVCFCLSASVCVLSQKGVGWLVDREIDRQAGR